MIPRRGLRAAVASMVLGAALVGGATPAAAAEEEATWKVTSVASAALPPGPAYGFTAG